MVWELVSILIAVALAYLLFLVLKNSMYLILNSILALIVLFLLNMIGINVDINIFTILIVAIAGFPGLVLVVLLHLLGIAF